MFKNNNDLTNNIYERGHINDPIKLVFEGITQSRGHQRQYFTPASKWIK